MACSQLLDLNDRLFHTWQQTFQPWRSTMAKLRPSLLGDKMLALNRVKSPWPSQRLQQAWKRANQTAESYQHVD